jgi:putative nucleotidyltransferase with HDIG domain
VPAELLIAAQRLGGATAVDDTRRLKMIDTFMANDLKMQFRPSGRKPRFPADAQPPRGPSVPALSPAPKLRQTNPAITQGLPAQGGVPRSRHAGRPTAGQRLLHAFGEFETFPALRASRDAMVAAAADPASRLSDLIQTIESDPALAIAVLRAAARHDGKKAVAVPSALAVLSREEIAATAGGLAVFDFFEQSRAWSETAERFRVHARATQSAAEYVRRAAGMGPRPDLLVAALLHDIGKLVLLRAYERYETIWNARTTAAQGLALERAELGLDHALAGGVLARRLGLPDPLVRTIEHHHDENAIGDAAVIRLADMLAHYATGGTVDPSELSTAGRASGLSPDQLRRALDELPGGGHRDAPSGEPSPLTSRETEMMQKLADGKAYKQIAVEFGLQASTVRTHLYNTYRKLGVSDRAQAVLLTTSHGWL